MPNGLSLKPSVPASTPIAAMKRSARADLTISRSVLPIFRHASQVPGSSSPRTSRKMKFASEPRLRYARAPAKSAGLPSSASTRHPPPRAESRSPRRWRAPSSACASAKKPRCARPAARRCWRSWPLVTQLEPRAAIAQRTSVAAASMRPQDVILGNRARGSLVSTVVRRDADRFRLRPRLSSRSLRTHERRPCSTRNDVPQHHNAAFERAAFGKLEAEAEVRRKHRLAAAEDDRADVQPDLVYEAHPKEGGRGVTVGSGSGGETAER